MSKKKIFISPLDWGLGHATRCISIIKALQELNCEVILGASGVQLELIKKEFPSLPYLKFPGYNISYPKNGSMTWQMIKSSRKIIQRIILENQYIAEIHKKYKLNGIISDNRYGLYHSDVPCVFITHQLNIQAPTGEPILKFITNNFIEKYTECWVPDVNGDESYAGKLSQYKPPKKAKYIGTISRLNNSIASKKQYDILVIVSGPEPQRSIFEQLVLNQLKNINKKVLVVLGQPDKFKNSIEGNIEIRSHLTAQEMSSAISSSEIIISRPGYSTIMDLSYFGKKAVFVPTPGQTEQEYLAKYHSDKGHAPWQKQNKLNINSMMEIVNKFKGIPISENGNLLKTTLKKFIEQLK